jgi:hypothetical protein
MFPRLIAMVVLLLIMAAPARGRDVFLTIGGGGSPQNNQLSLERNVIFFQHVLAVRGLGDAQHDIFFACGNDPNARDLQLDDPNTPPPRANLLLARLFGRDGDDELYHSYRPHQIENVTGPANRAAIVQWFQTTGARLADGDRLFIYFTGHGGEGRPERNTTMDLWLDRAMPVKEFTGLLEKLNPKVSVVLFMVQCHAGGFGDVIFKNADVGPVLADANRCGFFATWHTRLAAGCTPDTAEDNYKDYSTYFYAALSGKTRTGRAVDAPDYDHDGQVSMAEAHAYVMLTSDTVDIPVCTSDVLLRQFSKTSDGGRTKGLATASMRFEELLKLGTPDRRAVLEGLSQQLELKGDDRAAAAKSMADAIDRERRGYDRRAGGGGRGGGANQERENLRRTIRGAVLARWPEMNSAWHPAVTKALSTEPDEIVKLIEAQPGYARWDELNARAAEASGKSFELERKWVKCQRFLYTAESVALEANLEKFASKLMQKRYEALRAAENASFGKVARTTGP